MKDHRRNNLYFLEQNYNAANHFIVSKSPDGDLVYDANLSITQDDLNVTNTVIEFLYSAETAVNDTSLISEIEFLMVDKLSKVLVSSTLDDTRGLGERITDEGNIVSIRSFPADQISSEATCTPVLDPNNFCYVINGFVTLALQGATSLAVDRRALESIKHSMESDNYIEPNIKNIKKVTYLDDETHYLTVGMPMYRPTEDTPSATFSPALVLLALGLIAISTSIYCLLQNQLKNSGRPSKKRLLSTTSVKKYYRQNSSRSITTENLSTGDCSTDNESGRNGCRSVEMIGNRDDQEGKNRSPQAPELSGGSNWDGRLHRSEGAQLFADNEDINETDGVHRKYNETMLCKAVYDEFNDGPCQDMVDGIRVMSQVNTFHDNTEDDLNENVRSPLTANVHRCHSATCYECNNSRKKLLFIKVQEPNFL